MYASKGKIFLQAAHFPWRWVGGQVVATGGLEPGWTRPGWMGGADATGLLHECAGPALPCRLLACTQPTVLGRVSSPRFTCQPTQTGFASAVKHTSARPSTHPPPLPARRAPPSQVQAVGNVLRQCYADPAAVTDELVDIILKPGLQPGAVEVRHGCWRHGCSGGMVVDGFVGGMWLFCTVRRHAAPWNKIIPPLIAKQVVKLLQGSGSGVSCVGSALCTSAGEPLCCQRGAGRGEGGV